MPYKDLDVRKAKQREYYRLHKDKIFAYRKRRKEIFGSYYSQNKEVQRKHNLWHKYRLTVAEYNAMVKRANGKCKICRTQTKLVIDHDHTTGMVRGLICDHCNRLLGGAKDSIKTLRAAIKYLSIKR